MDKVCYETYEANKVLDRMDLNPKEDKEMSYQSCCDC